MTNSEVVRPNPAAGVVKGYHDRPEVDMSTVLELETVDDSPWRRVLVADEEIVDQGNFTPVGQDVEIKPLAAVTTVLDQTGAPWSVTTWAWCAAF